MRKLIRAANLTIVAVIGSFFLLQGLVTVLQTESAQRLLSNDEATAMAIGYTMAK